MKIDPSQKIRVRHRDEGDKLDEVNSFGLIPSSFDRPDNDVITVGPITLRGTF